MKRLLPLIFIGAITLVAGNAYAISVYQTLQGGTGSSSPSGLLYGDNNATTHLNTVTVGSNLTFSGGTLSATGGSSFGEAWQFFSNKGWLAPTTSVGIIVNASSTIGDGVKGLTISGAATTTGNQYIVGTLGVGTPTPNLVNASAKLTAANTGAVDIIASSTDNTTLSTGILEAYAPGSRVFIGAHGTSQITTQYGLVVGGYAELGAINSSFNTSNGLLIGTRTTATPIIFGTNSLERMRIQSNGAVGIGTTSPYALLSLMATSTGGNFTTLFAIGSSTATATTTLFQVNNIGNVGVDTSPTGARFEIQGTTTDSTGNGLIVWDSNGKNVFNIGNNGSTTLSNFGVCSGLTTTAAGTLICGPNPVTSIIAGSGITTSGTNAVTINASQEFTPFTNYAVNTNATTSVISFRGGLFASSTSNFDQLNVGSTTITSLMATSTFFGNVSIRNNASSTNLFVSSLGSAATTNICALTNGFLTITGCNNGTVTAVSVASANGFAGTSGGGATPALTLTTTVTGLLKGNGTAISAAALTDFPTQAANTVIANGTGATAAPTALATSSIFTLGAGLTQSSTLFQQKENRGFSYATTSWSGTTTVQLGLGYGEVWNNIICKTNTGTVNVDFYHATNHFVIGNSFNASTTVGTIFNLQNQTDTAKDAVQVDLGTPASSPLNVTCTVNDTI